MRFARLFLIICALSWAFAEGELPESEAHFSELALIDRSNVAELRVAWVADLDFTGRVQGAPTVWNGVLYVSTALGITALDAVSGAPVWTYTESSDRRTVSGLPVQAPRGSPTVITHGGGATLYASLPHDAAVVALDAASGALIWRTNVGDPDYAEALRTNPTQAGDLLVVGPTGADFSPVPGRLIALSSSDGSTAWTFDLVPVSHDDPAWASWAPLPPGRSFGVGGGSAWNVGAYDEVNGVVIFGTGEPVPSDRLDPRRNDGAGPVSSDLYTSSFVAIEAATGKLQWYHQVVPGDEWGFDQHTVPIVTTLAVAESERRVALLATTTGFVLVVDILTGELLVDHDMAGIGNVHTRYDDSGEAVIDQSMRRESADDVVRICPGSRWASIAPAAFSNLTGLLYRPNDLVCVRWGAAQAPDDWQPGGRPSWLLAEVRYAEDFFSRWGALTALDPLTGRVAWSFELPYPHDAGVLATAGGLVFSAFADRQFRAFDSETGEVLWTQLLSSHSDATPITYVVNGVQHVAVMAGRDIPVQSLPASGLPGSIVGGASLYVFALKAEP